MGKNKQPKDQAPNPSSVANREIFQRLNFLYQASAYLKGLETPAVETPASAHAPREGHEQPGGRRARKRGGKRRRGTLGELGSSYVRCMRVIGNKTVVRMDPSVKRTLCKGCDTVLLSGTTASVRIKGSNMGHKVIYTCLTCHRSNAIPAPPVAIGSGPADALNPPSVPMSTTSLQDTLKATQTPAPDLTQMQPPQHNKKRRKPPMRRPLPLFARPDAGHVVFRGNDVLTESQE